MRIYTTVLCNLLLALVNVHGHTVINQLIHQGNISDALLFARSIPVENRSQFIEWISTEATIESFMGVPNHQETDFVHTSKKDCHQQNGTVCDDRTNRTPMMNEQHFKTLKMVHYMYIRTQDNKLYPVYTGNHSHFRNRSSSSGTISLLETGMNIPIAGLLVNGTFYADSVPYECRPVTSIKPVTFTVRTASTKSLVSNTVTKNIVNEINCSLSGRWNVYPSVNDIENVANERVRMGKEALRQKYNLPSLTQNEQSMLEYRIEQLRKDQQNSPLPSFDTNFNYSRIDRNNHHHQQQQQRKTEDGRRPTDQNSRHLQVMPQLSPTSTSGVRTVLAVRIYYTDQNYTHSTTETNYHKYLDYLYDTHGKRSFGRLVWNITRTPCYYGMKTISSSNVVSLGAGQIVTESLNAINAGNGTCVNSSLPCNCRFNTAEFQHYVYFMPGSPFSWSGLGSVNGPNVWINGQYDAMSAVLAHEIGHNYGLLHASTQNPTKSEYGDSTDVMGGSFDMIGGDYQSGYKHGMNWIDNADTIQVDPTILPSATFYLAAMDRNNTIGAEPPVLPNGVVLAARAPIPPRTLYMPSSTPAYLYLSYRSFHNQGVSGVYINEVPVGTGSVGNSFLVCMYDPSCSQQLPLFMHDSFVYDPAGIRLLIETGPKIRILPGNVSTTDMDSALAVRMLYLDPAGQPVDSTVRPGCSIDGCVSSTPNVTTVKLGHTYPLSFDAIRQAMVFRLDSSLDNTIVVITTCPSDNRTSVTLPTAISVVYNAFPTALASYGGNIGFSGDVVSGVTYNTTGGILRCGRVTITAFASTPTWIVVGSPGSYRGTTVTLNDNIHLSITAGTNLTTSWFPYVYLPSSVCQIPGTYTLIPNTFVQSQPTWITSNGRYFLLYSSAWGKWIVTDGLANTGAFCVLGATKDYRTTSPNFGICADGAYLSNGVCTSCGAGMKASIGATSATSCTCGSLWTYNTSLNKCVGPSIGGPVETRSLQYEGTYAPIPLKSATICPTNYVPDATTGKCILCPPGASTSGYGASVCINYPYYNTVWIVDQGSWTGKYIRNGNVTYNGLPTYKFTGGNYYLQNVGSSWSVVANVGDSGSYAYFGTVLHKQPPQYITNGVSYALCDKEGDFAFDFYGQRICYCPGGTSPNTLGICEACPMNTYRDISSPNDTCVMCDNAYGTTSAKGSIVCDVSYCTGFNLVFFSACTANYAGCSAALTDSSGNFTLYGPPSVGSLPVYYNSVKGRYLYFHTDLQMWIFDSDVNATNGYIFYQVGTYPFAVPVMNYLPWQSYSTWYISPLSNGTCLQCGRSSYGKPTRNGGGCQPCPSTKTTPLSTVLGTNTTSAICECAAGYYNDTASMCAPCSSTSYKSLSGDGNCISCPNGQVSTTSNGSSCACGNGYVWNTTSNRCEDINECIVNPSVCSYQCTNTIGSYTCSCPSGYGYSGSQQCVVCSTTTVTRTNGNGVVSTVTIPTNFIGNTTHCLPCPVFMVPDRTGTSCVCSDGYTGGGTNVCEPPAMVTFNGTGGMVLNLTLNRVQYITIPPPLSIGYNWNSRVKLPSPVYQGWVTNTQRNITNSVWLYYGYNQYGNYGNKWLMDQCAVLSTGTMDNEVYTVENECTVKYLNNTVGSYGYTVYPNFQLPLIGSVDLENNPWVMYQPLPFRTFTPMTNVTLQTIDKKNPIISVINTSSVNWLNNNGENTNATVVVVTVWLSGMVGMNDTVGFTDQECNVTVGSLIKFHNASFVDKNLAVNITIPSSMGVWYLCASSGSSLPAPGRPLIDATSGREVKIMNIAPSPTPSRTPSATSTSTNSVSVTPTVSNSSMGTASTTPSVSPTPSQSMIVSAIPSSTTVVQSTGSPSPTVSLTSTATGTRSTDHSASPNSTTVVNSTTSPSPSQSMNNSATPSGSMVATSTVSPGSSTLVNSTPSSSSTVSLTSAATATFNTNSSVSNTGSATSTVSVTGTPSRSPVTNGTSSTSIASSTVLSTTLPTKNSTNSNGTVESTASPTGTVAVTGTPSPSNSDNNSPTPTVANPGDVSSTSSSSPLASGSRTVSVQSTMDASVSITGTSSVSVSTLPRTTTSAGISPSVSFPNTTITPSSTIVKDSLCRDTKNAAKTISFDFTIELRSSANLTKLSPSALMTANVVTAILEAFSRYLNLPTCTLTTKVFTDIANGNKHFYGTDTVTTQNSSSTNGRRLQNRNSTTTTTTNEGSQGVAISMEIALPLSYSINDETALVNVIKDIQYSNSSNITMTIWTPIKTSIANSTGIALSDLVPNVNSASIKSVTTVKDIPSDGNDRESDTASVVGGIVAGIVISIVVVGGVWLLVMKYTAAKSVPRKVFSGIGGGEGGVLPVVLKKPKSSVRGVMEIPTKKVGGTKNMKHHTSSVAHRNNYIVGQQLQLRQWTNTDAGSSNTTFSNPMMHPPLPYGNANTNTSNGRSNIVAQPTRVTVVSSRRRTDSDEWSDTSSTYDEDEGWKEKSLPTSMIGSTKQQSRFSSAPVSFT